MRARTLAMLALAAVALAAAAWWQLDRRAVGDEAALGPVLPDLGQRLDALERIEVRGAGDAVLVSLQREGGRWQVQERAGWPANEREISRALFRLAEAKRVEAKTANPGLHARLGVEDVASAQAKGAELRLIGGGQPLRLVVGANHPGLGGSYARLAGDDQAWLLDQDLAPARRPVDWLDRRLVDLPMARVEEVAVDPADGPGFVLSRADGDFVLRGQPAGRLADPDDGNATAGFADQLALDDLAADDGSAATQTAVFRSVDGLELTVAAWRADEGTWARLSVRLDEGKALAWFAQAAAVPPDSESGDGADADAEAEAEAEAEAGAGAGAETDADAGAAPPAETPEARVKALARQVADWQSRFEGRRFLVPPHKAANLMKARADYLAPR